MPIHRNFTKLLSNWGLSFDNKVCYEKYEIPNESADKFYNIEFVLLRIIPLSI